jgi:hypothetical protein
VKLKSIFETVSFIGVIKLEPTASVVGYFLHIGYMLSVNPVFPPEIPGLAEKYYL